MRVRAHEPRNIHPGQGCSELVLVDGIEERNVRVAYPKRLGVLDDQASYPVGMGLKPMLVVCDDNVATRKPNLDRIENELTRTTQFLVAHSDENMNVHLDFVVDSRSALDEVDADVGRKVVVRRVCTSGGGGSSESSVVGRLV